MWRWHRCKAYQEAPGCSGGKPDVKRSVSDLQENPAHLLPPALNQNVNTWASLRWAQGETRRPVFFYGDLSSINLLLFSCTFTAASHSDFLVSRVETLPCSVQTRFSFKSYWHHIQWLCNLWELLGPLTEVVKHLDWLGRSARHVLSRAHRRLRVCAIREELRGQALSQINYSAQSN